VISPPGGAAYDSLLVARGRRIRVSRLTIDGGGPGGGEGRAVEVSNGSSNVRLARLAIRNVRQDGVHAWGVHSAVSVQDSAIDGGGSGAAGVYVADPGDGGDYRDTSVIRTRIRGFRHHGIHFSHVGYGDPDAALRALALDNRVTHIRDPARDVCVQDPQAEGCGTTEGGIWSGGARAAIVGNEVARTRWDGIQTVGSSTGTAIVGNRVRDTGTGIYLEHSTNRTLVARNRVARVGTGIKVEWTYGGVGSDANAFVSNRVFGASETGLFVDVGDDRNRILGNLFARGAGHSIVLQGSSGNLVRGNRACERHGDMVREQAGRWDTGELAEPRGNRLADNRSFGSCARR
jgi:parallel beta-helix repeat protein